MKTRICGWAMGVLASVFMPFYSQAFDDPSLFPQPFLLGDWNFYSQAHDVPSSFQRLQLTLNSDYQFRFRVYQNDDSVKEWSGVYQADRSTLILGADSSMPQSYHYQFSHNQLILDGVYFTKQLPSPLAGLWVSHSLTDHDGQPSWLTRLDLRLQSNFLFSMTLSGLNGERQTRTGIFYIDKQHLVFIYELGEENSRYQIQRNQLNLVSESGDVVASLRRPRQ